jgi:Ser/Thr protein kinase RdoA (MazF antagonist)
MSLPSLAALVLARYPAPLRGLLVALGNRGGFSGARLWRVHTRGGDLCLRGWPAGEPATRVLARHALMKAARDTGLTFVPAVLAASGGTTVVEEGGCVWELQEWLPGRADYRAAPSPGRLGSACAALADLHRAWQPDRGAFAVCPAVVRRLDAVRAWEDLWRDGWAPPARLGEELRLLAARSWEQARLLVRQVPAALEPWARLAVPIQPCLCDVWHDHLLFTGDELTGLVDYGSVKTDNVAADLARMLGGLAGDDEAGWDLGLSAYRGARPLSPEEGRLARVLDVTGAVLGVVNWLRWLGEREFEDTAGAARRLGELVARLESWPAALPCLTRLA